MLPAYYKHVRAFENTLVTKFYGLHCVKLTGATQKKVISSGTEPSICLKRIRIYWCAHFHAFQVRFVIMGNLFCAEYAIHRRFDLKGSSHGRTTDKPEAEIDPTITLKDLDLNYIFRLQKACFPEFCRSISIIISFLSFFFFSHFFPSI